MKFFKIALCWSSFLIFLPISLNAADLTQQTKKITTLSNQMHKLSYQIAPQGILTKEATKLTKVIENLESHLKSTLTELKTTPPSTSSLEKLQTKIQGLTQLLDLIDKEIQAKFKEIDQVLQTKGFNKEVFARHDKYVKEYHKKLSKLKECLDRIQEAEDLNSPLIKGVRGLYQKQDAESREAKGRVQGILESIDECLKYIESELKIDNVYRPTPPPELPGRRLPPARYEYIQTTDDRQQITDNRLEARLFTGDELKEAQKRFSPLETIPKLTVPTKGDLDETPDIQITQEIRDLAASLGHNPVKIYEWVKNNIDFVPYWGSFKGSQGTLIERSGNSFDTSSLLMALLRASNIPCQYGSATIGLDIERAKNWLGAESPEAVYDLLWAGYIPNVGLIENPAKQIVGIVFQHIFVVVNVPYGYYRGWQIDSSEMSWIPLDASFKQYDYIRGTTTARAVNFDFNDYYSGTKTLSPVEYYRELIENQGINLNDVRRSRKIRQEKVWFLPAHLPYKYSFWSPIYVYPTLSDKYRYLMAFDIGAFTFFGSRTVEFYGKRLTLSYEPAKEIDKRLVEERLIGLANYKLIVRLDGKAVAEGGLLANLGQQQELAVGILAPAPVLKEMLVLTHYLKVGSYYSVSLDIGGDASPIIQQRINKLEQAIGQGGNLWQDDIIGELLYIAFLKYQNDTELKGEELDEIMYYHFWKGGGEALTAQQIRVVGLFKLPANIELDANLIDAKWGLRNFTPSDGDYGINDEKWAELMRVYGMDSSFQEHRLWEEIVGIDSISAVKAIQYANTIGLPIHVINKNNLESELAQLQVADYIKSWIRNHLNANPDDIVTIPEDEFLYNDWYGVGWIGGGYYISGVLQGGMTTKRYVPILTINNPKQGEKFKPNEEIECRGEAWDRMPGGVGPGVDIGDRIKWTIIAMDNSTQQGQGKNFKFTPWVGEADYTISAEVSNDQNYTTYDALNINVDKYAGMYKDVAEWSKNQHLYNDQLKYWAEQIFPDNPTAYANIMKTIMGQEQQARFPTPGLPQIGGGPARGLGQVEVGGVTDPSVKNKEINTYEGLLLEWNQRRYLSEYQGDQHWQELAKAYQKILPNYDWKHTLAYNTPEGQALLNYGRQQYPLLTRKEYNDNKEKFTQEELNQRADTEIELAMAYYKWLLKDRGGKEIQDMIEQTGIVGVFGYNMGAENLLILKQQFGEKNWKNAKWENINFDKLKEKGIVLDKHRIDYYKNVTKWLEIIDP
ncbi:MAG: transglutaminase domain-containing protein [bacterium]|nr:transglutaminase domain-containing protein [bacterium]